MLEDLFVYSNGCNFSPLNYAEFLPAVCVNRLGWGCLRPDLWSHFAYRLPQVIHGVSEGKRKLGSYKVIGYLTEHSITINNNFVSNCLIIPVISQVTIPNTNYSYFSVRSLLTYLCCIRNWVLLYLNVRTYIHDTF